MAPADRSAQTRLGTGDRLGPYEVVGLVGTGGMGEVYKARDARLDRLVALKVLREPVGADPLGHGRFESEARAISGLQHPNICALHDVGEQGGLRFLVMEYLDGESLASRLRKGPLPPGQVVAVGLQLAEALSRAHREGIVHRDLKPANVMLTRAGAKLLDFGLARSPTSPPGEPEGDGAGTYPYMAPEQLQGEAFDHRSDIWALGCVLFEMASGRRAFGGDSPSQLMRAILSDELPRLATPSPALDAVVRVCLERDPEARWQSAADVARELAWVQDGASPRRLHEEPAAPPRRLRLIGLLVLVALTAVLATLWQRSSPPDATVVQASVLPPTGRTLPTLAGSLAVSPDGRQFVFTARDDEGRTQLYLRSLDSSEAVPLAGSEGGSQPFWSPDGRSIGFYASSVLRRVSLAGGTPETIGPSTFLFGATWGADDVVVAGTQLQGPLSMWTRGSTTAAAATTLDRARGESRHRWPHFLPGGRRFLYTSMRLDPSTGALESEIWAQAVGATERVLLVRAPSNAVYAPPGWLLYALDGNVVAQRFDPDRLALDGDPVIVARGVVFDVNVGAGVFSAGGDVLAFAPGGVVGLSRLVVLDRAGREVAAPGSGEDFWTPRVSPDGTRIAVERLDGRTGNRDVYVYDAALGGAPLRLTLDPGDEFTPVWSPDGLRLAYSARRGDQWSMRVREVGGDLAESIVPWSEAGFPTDWTPRGLYVNRTKGTGDADVVLLAEDGTLAEIVATPAIERDAVISRDGRFMAFVAWTSGRPDVFVQSVASGARWQVSPEGGRQPRWSRDGRELFFVSPAGRLNVVRAQPGGDFRGGAPQELFPLRLRRTDVAQYDVRPDGTFVANVEAGDASHPAVSLVVGWPSSLR